MTEGHAVDSLNVLRAVLVGGAFIAALVLAVDGRWLPALVLGVGILAHVWLWAYLWRERREERDRISTLEGGPPPSA